MSSKGGAERTAERRERQLESERQGEGWCMCMRVIHKNPHTEIILLRELHKWNASH